MADQENNQEKANIRTIIESMIELPAETEEEKEKMLNEAVDVITEAAIVRAVADADEETQRKFEEAVKKTEDPEEIRSIMYTYFPKIEDYVAEEIARFVTNAKAYDEVLDEMEEKSGKE